MESSLAVGLIFGFVVCLLIWIVDARSSPSRITHEVVDGDLETLRTMLCNCASAEKQEALFSAILHRRDEALDIVLEAGPSLTQPLRFGGAALHMAARYGTPHALERLLPLEVDIDQDCQGTPLYWAADEGRDEVVKRLIECGANAEAVDLNLLGKSGFKPNFNTPADYARIATIIREARENPSRRDDLQR